MDLARALKSLGLDLAEAHDALDRVAAGGSVDLALSVSPAPDALRALEAFGVGIELRRL